MKNLYESGFFDARLAVLRIIEAELAKQKLWILEEIRAKITELQPALNQPHPSLYIKTGSTDG